MNKVFHINNRVVTVATVAPPFHRNAPESFAFMTVFHQGYHDQKDLDTFKNELANASNIHMEYGRLSFLHALSHIQESIAVTSSDMSSLMADSKTPENCIINIFNDLQEHIETTQKRTAMKMNKSIFTSLQEMIKTYAEGVLFLQKTVEKFPSFHNLLIERKAYLDKLQTYYLDCEDVYALLSKKYVKLGWNHIMELAEIDYETSIAFDYKALDFSDIEKLMIISGDRDVLWFTVQSDEIWAEYIDKKLYRDLIPYEIQQLKQKLPDIIQAYHNMSYLSFTNMLNVLEVCLRFKGHGISIKNEDSKICYLNKKNIEIQILQNAREKSDELQSNALKINYLLKSIKEKNQIEDFLSIEFNDAIQKNIIKYDKSDSSIILYDIEDRVYGALVSNIAIGNGEIPSDPYIDESVKGSCFHSMAHFMRELNQDFVQEFYFEVPQAMTIVDLR